MFRKLGFASFSIFVLVFIFAVSSTPAQVESGRRARPVISQDFDERQQVVLGGHTRSEANDENDRGAARGDFTMEHMLLQLRRSPEQEQALQQFIDELNMKESTNFHRWITAQEFGQRFGLAKQDLDKITGWLELHGFKVNVVYPSGMVIDFSGTVEQVREAFRTEIHDLEVNGEKHVANMRDPRIPAALAPAVVGIVSLNDFRPHALHKMRKSRGHHTFDSLGATHALAPADLATIYNLNPLFSAGYSGQGQTIVLIEDTNVFHASDWTTFRSTFGLSSYSSGSFRMIHPAPSSGTNNCRNPGIVAPNDAEAILDAEWASAAAPNATIEMVSCADTTTTFGGLIALQNLINATSQPPAILSISYGQCEAQNGVPANAAYSSVYQQAVTEGVSVFVAAGDSGAAGCDDSASQAMHGIGVNALASTPYNVAVGGTDFSDTYSGTNSNYWKSTSTSTFASAMSYIPEIPWNDSCAGLLITNFLHYSTSYGSSGFCNSSLGGFLHTTVAGGGGPSGCATGAPSISGVVSGTCRGWPKPSWQSVLGNPNDGVRDTPDISLFAANGLWSHYYVFCWSNTKNGGAPCTGSPSGWSGAGGTSFASSIMAGIQALVNQKAGDRQGNPNPVYYELAAAENGSSGSSSCDSTKGISVAATCIFYDITQADIDVNCTGRFNCYSPSGTDGVLSTSDNSHNTAYGSATGWDFATGIGSVNAANLANNWPSSTPNFTLSASPGSLSVTQGTSGTSMIAVTAQNGFSGNVSLSASGLPNGVTASFSPILATTVSTLTLTGSSTATAGTVTVTITGMSGSLTNTSTITLTVIAAPNYALSASPSSLGVIQGASGASTITVTPQNGFSGNVSLSASGLPGGVTASFSPNPATGTSTLMLTAGSTATTGTVAVTITGMSGGLTRTTTISLTVSSPPPPPTVWLDQDVGQVGVAGSASYANGTFTVNASGQYIWNTADGMHFLYQPLSGDGTIVARVLSSQGSSTSRSAGVMIRETLNTSSANIYTIYSGDSYNYLVYRMSTGAITSAQQSPSTTTLPSWVKLVRSGSTFTGYCSSDGVNWVQIGSSQTISMQQNVYFGMALSSDDNSSLATATFDNVSINSAAAPAPVISSVSATTGAVGSQVVITGTGFGVSQGSSAVMLNGVQVTITAWSDTSITIKIPSGATSGPLAVLMAPSINSSNPVTFTVTP
jgi:hypothetical protein